MTRTEDPVEGEPERARTAERSAEARIEDVRRLVAAASRVYDERARWAPDIARSTGLSAQAVELGFACLERDASEDDLRSLIRSAGDSPHVHVVLSANVFVGALRALVLARAAAGRVTVRPSPRDPTLARALVAACEDRAITITSERDVSRTSATEVHVYGRDATVAAVRAQAPRGVVVRWSRPPPTCAKPPPTSPPTSSRSNSGDARAPAPRSSKAATHARRRSEMRCTKRSRRGRRACRRRRSIPANEARRRAGSTPWPSLGKFSAARPMPSPSFQKRRRSPSVRRGAICWWCRTPRRPAPWVGSSP